MGQGCFLLPLPVVMQPEHQSAPASTSPRLTETISSTLSFPALPDQSGPLREPRIIPCPKEGFATQNDHVESWRGICELGLGRPRTFFHFLWFSGLVWCLKSLETLTFRCAGRSDFQCWVRYFYQTDVSPGVAT